MTKTRTPPDVSSTAIAAPSADLSPLDITPFPRSDHAIPSSTITRIETITQKESAVICIPKSLATPARHVPKPKLLMKVKDAITRKFNTRLHWFNDLPVELRLQIWEAALPDARIHELCLPNIVTPKSRRILKSNNGKPPVVLHVCRESRQAALKHLQIMEYNPPPPAENEERVYAIIGFYFNPQLDTLYLNHMADGMLGYSFYLDYFDHEVPKTMDLMKPWQRIALDSHWFSLMTFRVGHLPAEKRFQDMFPAVTNVTVVWDKRWLRMWHVRQLAWPGKTWLVEPSTKDLETMDWHWFGSMSASEGTRHYMLEEYGDEESAPDVWVAKVKRERFMIRRDIRIAIRITSVRLGLKHLGPLRRI